MQWQTPYQTRSDLYLTGALGLPVCRPRQQSYFTPSPEGEFVGLYVLFSQRVVFAVLMNLPALYDERHLSKTVRATLADLTRLIGELTRALALDTLMRLSAIHGIVAARSPREQAAAGLGWAGGTWNTPPILIHANNV